ncbi:MAG: molybdopterin-guanine dinucleotide biosynthesis protein B [Myxococcaceae bacterium]
MSTAVSFIGWSGCGKTTLLERLVPELRARGVEVAVVKHSGHPHPLQPAGSDSERLARAGAKPVAFATPEGLTVTWRGDPGPRLASLGPLLGAGVLLVEGWKAGPFPKIEVWRRELGAPLATTTPVLAIVTDDELPPELRGLRRFGFAEVSGLALFVLRLTREVGADVT